MALTGTRTFVGFGFGAIQAGLFLYEAFHSGNFGRLVVAEVLPDVVAAIRQNDGYFTCNIALENGVEQARIGPIEIENPAEDTDRQRLIEAIAAADEISTAIPSVAYYASDQPGSLHTVVAAGLCRKAAEPGPPTVVYAAENHNQAAELLQDQVMAAVPTIGRAADIDSQEVTRNVRFLNTVIGKMSGLVASPQDMRQQGLAPVTPAAQRAFLVEAFNRILISQIAFEPPTTFQRGIEVFEEKPDLLPFEEAKLYGHNATHALAAYLAAIQGIERIADLRGRPGMLPFLRAAFIEESGAALIRKHAGVDALFTPAGYQAYTDDLLTRMTNPYLRDTVERVGRDPQRKLGWDDRLIGTMRLALQQNIRPQRYALGAAAALATLHPNILSSAPIDLSDLVRPLWQAAAPAAAEQTAVLELLADALGRLRQWQAAGCPNLASV
jgi:mannitol-1-phosphate 5-dehydrogenase